jgi:hypothetical protein
LETGRRRRLRILAPKVFGGSLKSEYWIFIDTDEFSGQFRMRFWLFLPPPERMTFDVRRLRPHGIIERILRNHRYRDKRFSMPGIPIK